MQQTYRITADSVPYVLEKGEMCDDIVHKAIAAITRRYRDEVEKRGLDIEIVPDYKNTGGWGRDPDSDPFYTLLVSGVHEAVLCEGCDEIRKEIGLEEVSHA